MPYPDPMKGYELDYIIKPQAYWFCIKTEDNFCLSHEVEINNGDWLQIWKERENDSTWLCWIG